MGYELRREVRDVLPAGLLTAAERLLLLEIADDASDKTRKGYPSRERISRLTDLAERSVQETLRRIGEKWIEIRVEIGKDKNGNPVYAHKGRSTDYVFPSDLAAAYQQAQERRAAHHPVEGALPARPSVEATEPGASGARRCDGSVRRRDGSGLKPRQIRIPSPRSFPQEPSSLLDVGSAPPPGRDHGPEGRERNIEVMEVEGLRYPLAVYQELAGIGVDRAEADEVIPIVIAEHRPRSVSWWRTVGRNGDLAGLVAEARHGLRKAQARREAAASRLELRRVLAQSTPRVEPVYVSPGTKPRVPRVRTCKECRWGFIHDTIPARPCPTCQLERVPQDVALSVPLAAQ